MIATELSVRGVPAHVQRIGALGSPQRLIFVHGLTGNMASWYYTIGPNLAAAADVALYDVRGHGMSGRPATGYTIDDLGADLADVCAQIFEGAPAILVANSFGGLIALECAMRHAHRVAGVVLIDSLVGESDLRPLVEGLVRSESESMADVPPEAEIWFGRAGGRKRARFVAQLRGLTHDTSLLNDLLTFAPWVSRDYASLAMPVLGLYGGGSELLDGARAVFEHLPHGKLEIVDGSGHALLWEQPAMLSRRIGEFALETAGVAR